jgi:histidine ammonia-lyase
VPGAAFFDLDRTLISRSSTLALAGAFRDQRLIRRRQLVKAAFWQLLFARFGADGDAVRRSAERGMAVLTGVSVAEVGDIVSGGNFHGQPVSLALDVAAMALTQLSEISERRVEQLVNPSLSGLPPFLAKNSGLNSGFMIAQVTSAALVAESRVLSHPASVDSIPSSAGREDHVSMGMTAALKARQVAEFTRSCLAIEMLVAAQALDYRQPVKAGKGPQAAYELIRSMVPTMEKERELHLDIEAVITLIDSGELMETVRAAT